MAISSFPPAESGATTNDFILDKNDTTNNQFEMGRAFAAGGYSIAVTGSTAYDIYLLNATGSAVGYTNGTTVVASEAFESISALGLGTADSVSFTYNGPSTNAGASGTETGAGAYLTSLTPSDLPQIDDTTIVAGGNFASDVQITFTSGTVELAAKNVVVGSSTALVVTRPDGLIEDNAPYDLVAINPGVTPPSSSGANVLTGTVTAGTDPSFVTTSPILGAFTAVAFSTAILTSDSEGTVVNWEVTAGTLPSGLALATATGAISGTPTADGDYYFTVQITDDGGNTNSAEFNLPVGLQVTTTNSTAVGGTTYAWFTSSGDLSWANATTAEYLVIAGGGGGGNAQFNNVGGGGGGAGGLLNGTLASPASGSAAVTVGAGGVNQAIGSNSSFAGYATATGGGNGGNRSAGAPGGSGGGGGADSPSTPAGAGGTGIAGQGNNGGNGGSNTGGGGGGAGATGGLQTGGNGSDFGAWASAIGVIIDGGYYAGGGGGGYAGGNTGGGLGGGGNAGNNVAQAGDTNSGGGGGGGPEADLSGGLNGSGGYGGSGLVVVRFT